MPKALSQVFDEIWANRKRDEQMAWQQMQGPLNMLYQALGEKEKNSDETFQREKARQLDMQKALQWAQAETAIEIYNSPASQKDRDAKDSERRRVYADDKRAEYDLDEEIKLRNADNNLQYHEDEYDESKTGYWDWKTKKFVQGKLTPQQRNDKYGEMVTGKALQAEIAEQNAHYQAMYYWMNYYKDKETASGVNPYASSGWTDKQWSEFKRDKLEYDAENDRLYYYVRVAGNPDMYKQVETKWNALGKLVDKNDKEIDLAKYGESFIPLANIRRDGVEISEVVPLEGGSAQRFRDYVAKAGDEIRRAGKGGVSGSSPTVTQNTTSQATLTQQTTEQRLNQIIESPLAKQMIGTLNSKLASGAEVEIKRDGDSVFISGVESGIKFNSVDDAKRFEEWLKAQSSGQRTADGGQRTVQGGGSLGNITPTKVVN